MKLLLKVHHRESDSRRRSVLNFNANHTQPTSVDTSSKYSVSSSAPLTKSANLPYSVMLLVLLGCAFGLTYVFHRLLQEDETPPR